MDLFIGRDADVFIDEIQQDDIVAFSVMSGQHQWALETAADIKKKKKALTVFGGPHPTFFPGIINHPGVDVVCCGEGESAMLDLADAYDKGRDYSNIPNLSVKTANGIKHNKVRPLIGNLDSLPFFDRDLYYNKYKLIRDNPLKVFIASRGCPFSCSFCFNERLREIYSDDTSHVRFYSPRRFIDEIKYVQTRYGMESIYFNDDIFALDKKWVKEFTAIYRDEIKKPFVCSANVHTLDEEIIRLLKGAGCHAVSFGIETGNEKLRFELLNKNITNIQIKNIASLFKKHRLKFITFNTLGLPGETIENALETIKLNIAIGADYPRSSFLTPYPGTKIAERFKDKIKINDIDCMSQQMEISFEVPKPKELKNLHYFFQTAVKFPHAIWAIKRLITLPPNALFKLCWGIMYFIIFVKSERRPPLKTIIYACKTF